MMKYPIGIQAFDCLREEGYEYVDITWARRNCSRDLPSRNWKRNGRPTRYFTLTSEQVLT